MCVLLGDGNGVRLLRRCSRTVKPWGVGLIHVRGDAVLRIQLGAASRTGAPARAEGEGPRAPFHPALSPSVFRIVTGWSLPNHSALWDPTKLAGPGNILLEVHPAMSESGFEVEQSERQQGMNRRALWVSRPICELRPRRTGQDATARRQKEENCPYPCNGTNP